MNVIDKILQVLRKLIGLEEDIDKIMKPISRITRKLERYQEHQLAKAEADEEAAVRAKARAAREREVAAEAERLREKFA